MKQQDDLLHILTRRNDDIEHIIQQHEKQIIEFEDDLLRFEDLLINSKSNFSIDKSYFIYTFLAI